VSAPRVDIVLFVGTDRHIDMEVIEAASMVDVTGKPVPPAQWVPLDVTGVAFRFDLREEPTSAAAKIGKDCTIIGAYNASRAANTQRVRTTLTDDDTAAANLGANGGLFWYSIKRTTDGAEAIALYGQARVIRATQA
jgi:hypothetical protein